MNERLKWQEILAQYPHLKTLPEGEQVNMNHVGCPAGADKKQRLYVKRKNGLLLGFCHNCQQKGAKGTGQKSHIRRPSGNVVEWRITLPDDLIVNDLPPHAAVWLGKYGVTQAEREHYQIGWSASLGRVVLPVFNKDGMLVAYQTRKVMPHDDGPKYLTARRPDVKHPMFLGTINNPSSTVVLTEDILSAIIVGREANAVSLLGVYLSDANVYDLLSMGFKRFVIILDDDNPAVKQEQRKLQRKLCQFGEVKLITGHATDPKEWTRAQVQEAIAP